MQKHAHVCKSLQKYVKACTSMQKHAQECKSMQKYSKAYSKQKQIWWNLFPAFLPILWWLFLAFFQFYEDFFPPFFKFYEDFFRLFSNLGRLFEKEKFSKRLFRRLLIALLTIFYGFLDNFLRLILFCFLCSKKFALPSTKVWLRFLGRGVKVSPRTALLL
jgi:hypothetical protein